MPRRPPDEDEFRIRGNVRLEAFVVVLVVAVLVALAVWFFFFAGSPLAPYN